MSRIDCIMSFSLTATQDLPDDVRGKADPQTYLHRIGRTGRFGRVGVSINLISGPRSYKTMMDISNYFGVDMTGLPYEDWDRVEEIIKHVIKSSRAGPGFQTTNAIASGHANGSNDVTM